VDNQNRLFVIEDARILKAFDDKGNFLGQHKFKKHGAFTDPRGMEISDNGMIYIVLENSCQILKISPKF